MDLRPGEHILFKGRPSWRALFSFYLVGLLIAIGAGAIVFCAVDTLIGILVAVGVFVAVLVIGYVRRMFVQYVITNRRLRISRGLIARKVQETRLDRVQNVNYSQGVFDRILRVGTVDFDTAGQDDAEFKFDWVNDPDGVVQAVDQAQHEALMEGREPEQYGLGADRPRTQGGQYPPQQQGGQYPPQQ
jgi:uncharacterized membrane protein YdbT with pleckstrin-like domain